MPSEDQVIMVLHVPGYGGSKGSGSASSLSQWKEICRGARVHGVAKEKAEYHKTIIHSFVYEALGHGSVPCLLGGDHSLTFHVISALRSRFHAIDILHFDAHHDSYNVPELNNYSVFYHLGKIKGMRVHNIGCRYDSDKSSIQQKKWHHSGERNPLYISIDVDYFPPECITSVNFPVPSAINFSESIDLIKAEAMSHGGKIIGLDIMEWLGSPMDIPRMRDLWMTMMGMVNENKM